MANTGTVTLQLVAAVANGICLSQAVAGAQALTLNGSLVTSGVAIMDVARRVLIASAGADSAVVFTLTGTDRYGNVQSETITGVAVATPQFSARDYKTITAIRSSAATAGNITIGTNGVGSSDWVGDAPNFHFWALSGGCVSPAGTTYTVEHTYDDPNRTGTTLVPMPSQFSNVPGGNIPPVVFPNATVAAVSGVAQFDYPNHPIYAHRLTINSGTGLVVMQSLQAGI